MALTLEQVRQYCHSWVAGNFRDVYVNPSGVIVVPYRETRVFIHALEQQHAPGNFVIWFRAPISMSIPESADFIEFRCNRPKMDLLNYHVYEDNGQHVDFSYEAMATWLDETMACELVQLMGENADEFAPQFKEAFGGRLPREEWARA